MTNHEAIQFLNNMIDEEHGRSIGANGFYRELCAYHVDALRIAIKALEQEPCEDAISRQAVEEIINDIRDCISVEGYCAMLERMKKLPSVKSQEPQSGHWQKHTDASGNSWHTCPACGHIAYTLTRFCPDCGKRLEAPS